MRKVGRLIGVVDPFVAALMGVVVLAYLLPCSGRLAIFFDFAADSGIVLLFFLHGAKLSREAILGGMLHWRLHLVTLTITFVVFPVLGLLLIRMPGLDPSMAAGLLYLTFLPSTVQSSIAFTSIAGGNVPAAVCAATLSNLLGMFLTPLLVAIFMQVPGTQSPPLGNLSPSSLSTVSLDSIKSIALQLLLPFLVGHLASPWLSGLFSRHKSLIGRVDRGAILLVVYTAFSASIVGGLWSRLSFLTLLVLVFISCGLLGFVIGICRVFSQCLRLNREDSIVLLFCGSKKSLASGVPIAGTLFPASEVGLMILPLMIFHQIQLIACAAIARRLAKETSKSSDEKAADGTSPKCESGLLANATRNSRNIG